MLVEEVAPFAPLDLIELHAELEVSSAIFQLLLFFLLCHSSINDLIHNAKWPTHWASNQQPGFVFEQQPNGIVPHALAIEIPGLSIAVTSGKVETPATSKPHLLGHCSNSWRAVYLCDLHLVDRHTQHMFVKLFPQICCVVDVDTSLFLLDIVFHVFGGLLHVCYKVSQVLS